MGRQKTGLGAALAVFMWVGASGCPRSSPSGDGGRPTDVAVDADSGPDPLGDRDEDGLCDSTEDARGTDPDDPDTDGDGFIDLMEILFGFDPQLPADPDRMNVFPLAETPAASIQIPLQVEVEGAGEEYQGAFEALRTRERDGSTATTFFVGASAVIANPEDHAGLVHPEQELFIGVTGRTILHFEVRFAFGAELPRGCVRGYPFQYQVKRSDGTVVYRSRFLLLVLPAGATLATADWCRLSDTCM
jgi:hypothetical protein